MVSLYKELIVRDVARQLEASPLTIVAQHRGLTVADLESLRRALDGAGAEVLVLKQRLAKLACRQSGQESLADAIAGQIALVFGEEAGAITKALADFAKGNEGKFSLLGGMVEGRFLDTAGLVALAALPSRAELLAMVVGAIQGPIAGLVRTLAAVPTGLVRALDAVARKKQEQSG